jgi:hypothetical protein
LNSQPLPSGQSSFIRAYSSCNTKKTELYKKARNSRYVISETQAVRFYLGDCLFAVIAAQDQPLAGIEDEGDPASEPDAQHE